jgi:hypothetical protein
MPLSDRSVKETVEWRRQQARDSGVTEEPRGVVHRDPIPPPPGRDDPTFDSGGEGVDEAATFTYSLHGNEPGGDR